MWRISKRNKSYQGDGIKLLKYGKPKKENLGQEVRDILKELLNKILYYKLENEFSSSLEEIFQKLKNEGYLGN